MSRRMVAVVLAMALLANADVAFANRGDLDPRFGADGVAFSYYEAPDTSLVVLPDPIAMRAVPAGKLTAVGGNGVRMAISRYNADGSADLSFGPQGYRLYSSPYTVQVAAVDADASVYVGTIDAQGSGVMFHVLSDGSIDPTFGVNGFAHLLGVAHAITIAPDGSLYATHAYDDHTERRLHNGAVDTTFGQQGQVGYSGPLAVQSDKKVVFGLFRQTPSIAMTRLLVNGAPDPTFGSSGVASQSVAGADPSATSASPTQIVIRSDGRILMVGATSVPSGPGTDAWNALTWQVLTTGQSDPTWGSGGLTRTSLPTSLTWAEVLLGAGNTAFVVGSHWGSTPERTQYGTSTYADLVFARFDTTGHLDTGFGVGGLREVNTRHSCLPTTVALSALSDVVVGCSSLSGGATLVAVSSDGSAPALGSAPPGRTTNHFPGWIAGGGVLRGSPALIGSAGGTGIYIRGADNALWYEVESDVYGTFGWGSFGGQLSTSPAVADTVSGAVFAAGSDHQIWQFANSTWTRVGGTTNDTPAVASWDRYRIDLFVRGTDNQLWHRVFDGTSWGQWEALGGTLTSAPAVTTAAPGNLDVAVRGADGAVYSRSFTNGWGPWLRVGGYTVGQPALVARSTGELDLFVCGGDAQLWNAVRNGTVWTGFSPLGGRLSAGPAAAITRDVPASTITVAVSGGDNGLWLAHTT